jgi:hypothetical protein
MGTRADSFPGVCLRMIHVILRWPTRPSTTTTTTTTKKNKTKQNKTKKKKKKEKEKRNENPCHVK